jgi:WD40 repeat protein
MPERGYPKPLFSPSGPNSVDASVARVADAEVASRLASSNFYVTVSEDGTIQLFSLPNQGFNVKENLLVTFKGASVTDIVFSPDSRFLSWGRGDGSVSLYDIQKDTLVTVVAKSETSQTPPNPEPPKY